jgi:pyruvate dehydrogenase E2 component (dihydrolipoamide acetyltransferase)
MTRQFTLPDLGEGLEEAEIVAWLVNEGDHVIANQPLVSVETDKVSSKYPRRGAGPLRDCSAQRAIWSRLAPP